MKKFRLLFLIIAAMLAGTQAGVAQNWKGATPTALKNAAGDDINNPSEEANFFLYNVGTGKFLTIGGQWGTQAVLKDVGLLLTMDKSIQTISNNNTGDVVYSIHTKYSVDTKSNNYLQLMDGSNSTSTHDEGIWYTDRTYLAGNHTDANQIKDDRSKDFATFYFHDLGNNKYNIYVMSDHTANTVEGKTDNYKSKRIYLVAPSGAVNNTAITSGVTENMTTAYNTTDANAQWMLIPLSEVRDNFQMVAANATEQYPADGSYIIRCQNFSRNNEDLHQWRIGHISAGKNLSTNYDQSIFSGTNKMLAPNGKVTINTAETNYYVGNGYHVDDHDNSLFYDNTTKKWMQAKMNHTRSFMVVTGQPT